MTLDELKLIKNMLEEIGPLEIVCGCIHCTKKKDDRRQAKWILEREIKLRTMDVRKSD